MDQLPISLQLVSLAEPPVPRPHGHKLAKKKFYFSNWFSVTVGKILEVACEA